MKLVEFKCPFCGAAIDNDIEGRNEIFCPYCGGKIFLDDEVKRSEHKETINKTVNVNNYSEKRYVDEAEVQKEKTERTKIKSILIFAALLIATIIGSCFFGYKYSEAQKNITLPSESIKVTFQKAILGKASEEANLIVMKQNLSVNASLEKEGLFGWDVFKKNKNVTYRGKAIYTVNLKQIRENDIIINEEEKTITLYVPTPEMYDLAVDPSDFSLGDTEKGFLSFGDMKFTLEEAFFIESQAIENLKKEAEKDEQIIKATKIAKDKINNLFQKTIIAVNPDYRLNIEFY